LDDVEKVIKIIDNFFEDILFKNIKNHVTTKLFFTPRYFEGREHTVKNYYGSRFLFSNDKNLLDTFIKQTETKFKIKINKVNHDCGIDIRNLENFIPHDDVESAKINILVMLKGPTAVTNGTVFYTDGELDIHVGFKENRAIMFPSNKVHSNHASNIPNLKRYTATLFIEDYEE
jgi:hypothetical protein|tara:strand:+ start:3892 stop:4413 length:522 start_codon:yes stop_codon:yes gene_type:complete